MHTTGGTVVSWLDSVIISRSNGPLRFIEPWLGHCVVFLGKTLNYHSASLHPGVQMGTSELKGARSRYFR